jgi:hypothetical protein
MLTELINLRSLLAPMAWWNAALPRQHSGFAIIRHSIAPAKVRLAFLTGRPQHLPDLQAHSSTHNGGHFNGKRVFRPSESSSNLVLQLSP